MRDSREPLLSKEPFLKTSRSSCVLRAEAHGDRLAIIGNDVRVDYDSLVLKARQMAAAFLREKADFQGRRVAFLLPPGANYICCQWAVWLVGGVAVPLSPTHPYPEHNRVIEDSGAEIIIVDPELESELGERGSNKAQILDIDKLQCIHPTDAVQLDGRDTSEDALILYTSGTTGLSLIHI